MNFRKIDLELWRDRILNAIHTGEYLVSFCTLSAMSGTGA